MALQQIPGFTGFVAEYRSSLDPKVIGKFTDSNHLGTLFTERPSDYDKKLITLYTQTQMFSNDFLNMINQSTPFYLDSNSDYFRWNVTVPFKFATIIEIPQSTLAMPAPGIDGHEFELVIDKPSFVKNDVITSHRMFAQNFHVITDPTPYNAGYIIKCTLLADDPSTEYVSSDWLKVGLELEQIDHMTGEFDTDLSGLDEVGSTLTLYDTMSAGYGVKHAVTDWADARTLKDANGRPLDMVVYKQMIRNAAGEQESIGERWEPVMDMMARRKMLRLSVNRMIWGKGGTAQTSGSHQEVKKGITGIYKKMRDNGNLIRYNRGEFTINLLRDAFGDLFYRRVAMKDRRVKMYTNEAGISVWRQALMEDARGAGIVFTPEKFIEGQNQNMVLNYAFSEAVTMETGRMQVVHLSELDLPQTNSEFGQNKKSTPIFFIFDISPTGDGTPRNNIRTVRHRSRPSMTWGYVDGAIHHLGFAKSQGMSSANTNPWYELWMKDRSDIFIEDLSKTVIIEEIPQF